MNETRVTFPCGDLSLDGRLSIPEGEGSIPGVVICHPHPLMGGMMDNNVVFAICDSLCDVSITTLRFNFRGVGRSHGVHDEGIGEQDDIAAALSFLSAQEGVDTNRIGLCGYSFGAGVALHVAAKEDNVKALALVSPLLSVPSPIQDYVKPKLLLWGDRDLALPTAEFDTFTEKLPDPKLYKIFSGVDHFWGGHESKMSAMVVDFFKDIL